MLLREVNRTSLVCAFCVFNADHLMISFFLSSSSARAGYGIIGDDSCEHQLSVMNHNTASSDCNVNTCTDHVQNHSADALCIHRIICRIMI